MCAPAGLDERRPAVNCETAAAWVPPLASKSVCPAPCESRALKSRVRKTDERVSVSYAARWRAAVRPDGGLIASGSRDKTIRIWDPDGGACVGTLEGCEEMVFGLAFHPQPHRADWLLSGEKGGVARLWSLDASRALHRVAQKLDGYEGGELRSVEGQVQQLLQDARDPEKLCAMYPGWAPWL